MAKTPRAGAGSITETVRRLALPVVEEYGVLLWDVRFVKEGADWFLRVYIDRTDAPVSIDDCVNVSRRLSDLLDDADPIPHSYCLEVLSSGIERELCRPEHFAAFEGAEVSLRLYYAQNGVKVFEGILLGMNEGGQIRIRDAHGSTLTFEKKEVSSVHVKVDWDDDAQND